MPGVVVEIENDIEPLGIARQEFSIPRGYFALQDNVCKSA
jgi:hypothetical protein